MSSLPPPSFTSHTLANNIQAAKTETSKKQLPHWLWWQIKALIGKVTQYKGRD